MVIVPSRDHVGSYAELKTRIDEEIGSINGKYSTMDWTPVCYFYHGFSFEELVAMYYVADVALVTPLRDGMNLVAKEYIAVKDGQPRSPDPERDGRSGRGAERRAADQPERHGSDRTSHREGARDAGAGAAETAEENAAHRLGANREPLGRKFYQRVELGLPEKLGDEP